MKSFKKGDMVYVPSQSRLYQMDESGTPTKYYDLKKPRNMLVLDQTDTHYKVLHAGQHWHIKRNNVYHTGGENVGQTY